MTRLKDRFPERNIKPLLRVQDYLERRRGAPDPVRERRERRDDTQHIRRALVGGGSGPTILTARAVWDVPSTVNLGVAQTAITVTGAGLGDPVEFSVTSLGATNWVGWANVQAADSVRVTLLNVTGAPVDPASGTLTVKVFKW